MEDTTSLKEFNPIKNLVVPNAKFFRWVKHKKEDGTIEYKAVEEEL